MKHIKSKMMKAELEARAAKPHIYKNVPYILFLLRKTNISASCLLRIDNNSLPT